MRQSDTPHCDNGYLPLKLTYLSIKPNEITLWHTFLGAAKYTEVLFRHKVVVHRSAGIRFIH